MGRRRSRLWLWLVVLVLLLVVVSLVADRVLRPPARGPLDAPTPPPPPSESASYIQVAFAPVPESRRDGPDYLLVALIGRARESIDCAFYELGYMPVAEALIAQHRAGVEVQIVTDSHYEDRPALQRCADAGIPIVFDERSAYMHNKFCVVDGRYVWAGSANITDNGFFRNDNNTLIIVSDMLAANYQAEFEEMFFDGYFGRGRETPYPVLQIGGATIENYFSPDDGVALQIIDEIEDAAERIDFMLFSFTSEDIAGAMAERITEGVQVRGIFEKRNAGSHYSIDEGLAERGAAVYYDNNPYAMHHKVIICDGDTVITGSYNMSKSAETRNDENVLIIHDSAVAARFSAEFERLLP